MRFIFIFFQILKPVEPRSSSIGLNPIDFSRSMVALVAAAPMASFLRKLSSLLKLFATRYLSILQLSVIIFAAGLMYWTENTLAEPQPVLQ